LREQIYEVYNGLKVYYLHTLDGGGRTFGQDNIDFIKGKVGVVDSIFEWCAGPGFIGFSLLSAGLCRRLILADINPKAIRACKKTIEENHLESMVTLYHSKGFNSIPRTEQWDLIIGNPPHSNSLSVHKEWGPKILYMDHEWNIHKDFYRNVKYYLKVDGNIIIQENSNLSSTKIFNNMIVAGGLRVHGVFQCRSDPQYYYIWSKLN